MEQITNYTYNDVVLYAKGWYKGTDNVCQDLAYFFSKIYWVNNPSEKHISILMLKVLDDIYVKLGLDRNPGQVAGKWLTTHTQFENEVNRLMYLYTCSRELAIIYAVMGVLHSMTRDEIKLNPPVYGKKEPFRLGCIGYDYPISQTYKEMNRIAQKFFAK